MQIENHKEEVPFGYYEERFRALDPQAAVKRLPDVSWDGAEFTVTLLGRTFAIAHPDYAIRALDDGKLPPLPTQTFFNLRYPFWHDKGLKISKCEMTELCRAALWYSEDVTITDSKLHGIKALRECGNVTMGGCDVISAEFGWSTRGIAMTDCTVQGEYFMLRSNHLNLNNVHLKGKYSFQYIEDSLFDHCVFDTKDAFWHAKNVTVRNSVVKGEYLAWYCENVTFENCKIIGTQPLCYCKGLKLENCEMVDTDLSFEKSEVEATLTAPILSIKNPLAGHIYVPSVGDLIYDDENAKGIVTTE